MNGCFFCWVIEQKREGLTIRGKELQGGEHTKCENHEEIFGRSKYCPGTTSEVQKRRDRVVAEFMERTEAGESPARVKKDLCRKWDKSVSVIRADLVMGIGEGK